MADIDIKQPAKINRNTAADGDFLWEKDFNVLYENDKKLEQAISQASQDYTAGDGISIDPTTKTISVKTGTGIAKTDEGLSVNIKGENIDVQYAEGKYTLSAFDSQTAFNELGQYAEAIDYELEDVKRTYTPKPENMVSGVQYVYSTDGWKAQEGGTQTIQYWRPGVDDDGNISWQLSDSTNTPQTKNIRGPQGIQGIQGEQGIQGATGPVGPSGFSPVVNVDDSTTGEHVVKITDLTHTETFTVKDGKDGQNGTNGSNGSDGKTPKLRVDSSTNRWQVSYDNGSTYSDISPATSATGPTGPAGADGFNPVVTASTIPADPTDPDHKNGGTKITISNRTGQPAEANIWNGNDGDATTVKFDTATGHTMSGNGGDSYPYGVNTSVIATKTWATEQFLDIPSYDQQEDDEHKIYNAHGQEWENITDVLSYYDVMLTSNIPVLIKPQNGLSSYVDSSHHSINFGLSAEYEDAIKDVANKVDRSGDTMTGNLSVVIDEAGNDSAHRAIIGAYDTDVDSDGTAFAIIGATRKKTNNYGTTWLGVASNGNGVLKNVPNASSAAANSSKSTQLTFGQNNNLPVLDLSIRNNDSASAYQGLATTQASYDGMALSGIDPTTNMSGPNYMIAKNDKGQLVIGAAVYNCQGNLPGTLQPNTYYFVF